MRIHTMLLAFGLFTFANAAAAADATVGISIPIGGDRGIGFDKASLFMATRSESELGEGHVRWAHETPRTMQINLSETVDLLAASGQKTSEQTKADREKRQLKTILITTAVVAVVAFGVPYLFGKELEKEFRDKD